MNVFRLVADMMHLGSILILMAKILKTRSAAGISFKSQLLYLVVFVARYIDVFTHWVSLYNFMLKIFFIASSSYFLYLMKHKFKATWDPKQDTFRAEFLPLAAFVLAIVAPNRYTPFEVIWTFSIWLESVAIIPQITMLSRSGVDTRITTYYLAALGAYRGFYILNWIYRFFAEGYWEWIPFIAGMIQTFVYANFFYVYYFKVAKGPKFDLPS